MSSRVATNAPTKVAPISENYSVLTQANIVMRFFATTPDATISDHPRYGGYNIPYHGTHVVESRYNLLHLSRAITPYSPPILWGYIWI